VYIYYFHYDNKNGLQIYVTWYQLQMKYILKSEMRKYFLSFLPRKIDSY